MTFHRQSPTEPAVAVVDHPQDLSTLSHSDTSAVIWRRQPLRSFQNWIDGLTPDRLPKGRLILRPDAVRDAVENLCICAGTPACVERTRLVDDIAALADVFADVTKVPYLRLRLEAVETNKCWKFHVDAVTARLICTYRGTGTQYGVSHRGAEPERVFTVPTGSPIGLRGTLWLEPSSADRLLHRSPPIAGTGETRLMLVLDPLNDLEEEA